MGLGDVMFGVGVFGFFGAWVSYLVWYSGYELGHAKGAERSISGTPISLGEARSVYRYRTWRDAFHPEVYDSLPEAPTYPQDRWNYGYAEQPDSGEKYDIREGQIARVRLEGKVHGVVGQGKDTLHIPKESWSSFRNRWPGREIRAEIEYQLLDVAGETVYFGYSEGWRKYFSSGHKKGLAAAPFMREHLLLEQDDEVQMIGIYITPAVRELFPVARGIQKLLPGMLLVLNALPGHGVEILEGKDKERKQRFNRAWRARLDNSEMENVKLPEFYYSLA